MVKITIDDLAKTMKGGFAKVDKKFAKVDKKFAKVDEKFDKIIIKQIDMEQDLKDVKKNMMTKDDKNEILNAIDAIAGDAKTTKEERIANQGAHNRIQEDVNKVRKHVGMDIKNPVLGGV